MPNSRPLVKLKQKDLLFGELIRNECCTLDIWIDIQWSFLVILSGSIGAERFGRVTQK